MVPLRNVLPTIVHEVTGKLIKSSEFIKQLPVKDVRRQLLNTLITPRFPLIAQSVATFVAEVKVAVLKTLLQNVVPVMVEGIVIFDTIKLLSMTEKRIPLAAAWTLTVLLK